MYFAFGKKAMQNAKIFKMNCLTSYFFTFYFSRISELCFVRDKDPCIRGDSLQGLRTGTETNFGEK